MYEFTHGQSTLSFRNIRDNRDSSPPNLRGQPIRFHSRKVLGGLVHVNYKTSGLLPDKQFTIGNVPQTSLGRSERLFKDFPATEYQRGSALKL